MQTQLEAEINDLHANICAGLADPKRIMLLYALADRAQTVSELMESAHMPQPSVSRHLKVLRDRGMVAAQRQGPSVLYSLADARLIQALDLLRGVLRDNLAHRANLFAVRD